MSARLLLNLLVGFILVCGLTAGPSRAQALPEDRDLTQLLAEVSAEQRATIQRVIPKLSATEYLELKELLRKSVMGDRLMKELVNPTLGRRAANVYLTALVGFLASAGTTLVGAEIAILMGKGASAIGRLSYKFWVPVAAAGFGGAYLLSRSNVRAAREKVPQIRADQAKLNQLLAQWDRRGRPQASGQSAHANGPWDGLERPPGD